MTVDLEFLGKQTERILAELRDIKADMHGTKMRLTAIESAIGLLMSQIAALNNRIDRIETNVRN